MRCPLLLTMLLTPLCWGNLRVNEVVASNRSGWTDGEGNHWDWIELYHSGDDPLALSGWHLSDDPDDPTKWAFPDISIPGRSYLVLFASGEDNLIAEEIHTNFKLDADGEILTLSDEEGTSVNVFTFPSLARDQAFGLDAEGNARFWRIPTPGFLNQEPSTLGPYLSNPAAEQSLAHEGEDYVISVQADANSHPIDTVRAVYRVLHKQESQTRLRDDGVLPDAVANDGRFTGVISAMTLFGSRYKAGEMVRWAFEAVDSEGQVARLPALDPEMTDQPEYFGTIIEDPNIDTSLPVLHWYPEDPDGAITETGSRCSLYFGGQFYDNLFVRRRGQFGAIQWPKSKLKFDFNPQDHFRYDPDRRRVEEFNLQSHYQDASLMRENLAFAFFNHIGTPAADTRHWHVRQNGEFYGLFSFVEQIDEDFLRQQGLDPDGAMYKANGFPSTLARVVTPALYQKETRKDEPYDDLEAFAEGINEVSRFHYLMDHVNIPAMVNEMAGQSVIRNADRLTKNYYMYRDPNTDLWQRFPWDMDGAFSTSSNLSTENYASPLYGDSEHTQAPGQPIYQNFLLDVILDYQPTRQMYLRRLRTLIDTYLDPESTYFIEESNQRLAAIASIAEADRLAWNTGPAAEGVRIIQENALSLRRRELLETFGKDLIPNSATPGLNLEIDQIDPSPSNAEEEYFRLTNPHAEGIDLSGWTVSGAVRFTFPPGTVLPRKGTLFRPENGHLYVVANVRAFRDRERTPHGDQGHFVVGNYSGKLANEGETLQIHASDGRLAAEFTFGPNGTTFASWMSAQTPEPTFDSYAFGDQTVDVIPETFALHYTRRADAIDLRYEVEASPDLESWTALDVPHHPDGASDEEGLQQMRVDLPRTDSRYFRVRAHLEP